ncbi:hypothetical protein [Haloplanus salinus]|jgi:hypothetical protein|nr:hypothetical protein [Haloplanus salinus]
MSYELEAADAKAIYGEEMTWNLQHETELAIAEAFYDKQDNARSDPGWLR